MHQDLKIIISLSYSKLKEVFIISATDLFCTMLSFQRGHLD